MLRIRDVYPGSWFLPIPVPDLGSRIQKQQQGGVKKISCHTFFCSYKFHKIVNYFIFEMLKKKVWTNFQRIIELYTQKLSLSSQKFGFGIRDPGSVYATLLSFEISHWKCFLFFQLFKNNFLSFRTILGCMGCFLVTSLVGFDSSTQNQARFVLLIP